MSTPEYTLNLTYDNEGVVHLHANADGLDELISSLQSLRDNIDKGICEHDHLMTEDWGGSELSTATKITADKHKTVHHLKIFAWTEEWAIKHGFKESINQ